MEYDRATVPALIRDLYQIVAKLKELFPGRPFTPDGHLVGSLAECYAAHVYGLKLHNCSNSGHDAYIEDCQIEIKATQGDRVAIRSGPERLLVFKLNKDGEFEEVYNGKGRPVWEKFEGRTPPSNGQFQVSLASLRKLNADVPDEERLPRVHP